MFFKTPAPSPLEVSLVNKTTSSICIRWSTVRGVVSGLLLSIKNTTSSQELIVSHQEPRSVSLLSAGSQIITVLRDWNYNHHIKTFFENNSGFQHGFTESLILKTLTFSSCVFTDLTALKASLPEANIQLKLCAPAGTKGVNPPLWSFILVSLR